MGDFFSNPSGNTPTSHESNVDKGFATALPIIGGVLGSFFGPIGTLVGGQIGRGAGNIFATGDLAGAPAGSAASNATNLGGLFQGRGIEGLLGKSSPSSSGSMAPASSMPLMGSVAPGLAEIAAATGGSPSLMGSSIVPGLEKISTATGFPNPYVGTG